MNRFMAVLPLSLLLLCACSQEDPLGKSAPPRQVQTLRLTAFSGSIPRTLPARVQAAESVPLGFEVAGTVAEVNLTMGQSFEKGQVIARLQKEDYRLQVAQQEAGLQQAQARLERAESDYRRKKDLVSDHSVSQAVFEAAEAEYKAAENGVKAARSGLDLARENVGDLTLTAPFSGMVDQRLIEPGQLVAPGQSAFTVHRGEVPELELTVPETLAASVDIGEPVAVTFFVKPGQSYQAVISEIGGRAVANGTFPVTLRLENPQNQNLKLRPGMTAEVTFQLPVFTDQKTDDGRLFLVPLTAFTADSGEGQFVYRVQEQEAGQSLVRKVPVHVESLFADQAVIRADLEENTLIVANGVAFLADGRPVRTLDDDIRFFQE